MHKPQDNNQTPPQTAPDATTYKASENVPSVRTLLPVPRFPKLDAPPESAQAPVAVKFDRAGNAPSVDKPTRGTIVGRQETGAFLLAPTRYNPATRAFEPVPPSTDQDAKPVQSLPIHDYRRQTS